MRLAWRSIISDNLDLFSFGMKKENKISGQVNTVLTTFQPVVFGRD